jgi:hypothetical protein
MDRLRIAWPGALLDQDLSCADVAQVLLPDGDTVRTWNRLYEEDGIEGLANFGYEARAAVMSVFKISGRKITSGEFLSG